MFSELDPQTGCLLISEPFMLDPHFERSVILLCDHDQKEGTLGFILNQKVVGTVGDLIKEISGCSFPLHIGGPVAQNELFFIHARFDLLLSGEEIRENIYFGGDAELLFSLINENKIKEEDIKFFIGYSGWQPDQLDKEIKENSWAVQNKFHSSLVFENDTELLWKQSVISLGAKYAHVANFPKSPNLN
ncbi:YqgE/AlgH family protein [Sphingobacterium sp. SRCM116780]|uniref:YqgE/AlgH family protein n=1 Tax=Sphingobacterium sp. SRCM116780 TaxID=2907623 RepID=UPI001F28B72C|nr:YqgE/AlgH family protein [Sphingobacterium sp. SRCM116780]UIR57592.1 YqgE/AlgH family protein [Sphingobacterium sp. SRCM116780]